MARLRRKLWVGIGCVVMSGVPLTEGALGQERAPHRAPPPGPAALATSAEGGEAYRRDGGPADGRIRFLRDLELLRGHLLVGRELIEAELWDEALPHFLHPTEELYGALERSILLHNIRPFRRELDALAQAVKAKRPGAYEQALGVVTQRLEAALAVVKGFMHPLPALAARSAAEVLKVALGEYASALAGARFARPVEYQDSRGFVWRADAMIEDCAAELQRRDAAALERIRATFSRLKAAWPTPMPPPLAVLGVDEVAALVGKIGLDVARY